MPLTLSGTSGVLDNSGAFIASNTVTASGTTVSFTSIPSWVKRVTMNFANLSSNGAGTPWLIQIGPSSGVETSGYLCTCFGMTSGLSPQATNTTNGFGVRVDNDAGNIIHGSYVLTLVGSNVWTITGMAANSNRTYLMPIAGSKSISGALSVVAITTNSGDTFDAGTINILYE